MTTTLTPTARRALTLLEGTHRSDTRSARVLAGRLWPEEMAECKTSLRRGGLYRSAGAYYSKLMKAGWCQHYMDDFDSGYYLTPEGRRILLETKDQTST